MSGFEKSVFEFDYKPLKKNMKALCDRQSFAEADVLFTDTLETVMAIPPEALMPEQKQAFVQSMVSEFGSELIHLPTSLMKLVDSVKGDELLKESGGISLGVILLLLGVEGRHVRVMKHALEFSVCKKEFRQALATHSEVILDKVAESKDLAMTQYLMGDPAVFNYAEKYPEAYGPVVDELVQSQEAPFSAASFQRLEETVLRLIESKGLKQADDLVCDALEQLYGSGLSEEEKCRLVMPLALKLEELEKESFFKFCEDFPQVLLLRLPQAQRKIRDFLVYQASSNVEEWLEKQYFVFKFLLCLDRWNEKLARNLLSPSEKLDLFDQIRPPSFFGFDKKYFLSYLGRQGLIHFICAYREVRDLEFLEQSGIVIKAAAAAGHLEIVKFLSEYRGIQFGYSYQVSILALLSEYIKAWCHVSILAAVNGHLKAVQYCADANNWAAESNPNLSSRRFEGNEIFKGYDVVYFSPLISPLIGAVAYGRLEVVRYLLEEAPEQVRLCVSQEIVKRGGYVIGVAITYGHFSLVKYLLEETPSRKLVIQGVTHDSARVLEAGLKGGDLEITRYLLEEAPEQVRLCVSQEIVKKSVYVIDVAIKNGHFSLVKYLLEETPSRKLVIQGIEAALKNKNSRKQIVEQVASKGDLRFVQYFLEQSPIAQQLQKDVTDYDISALILAMNLGHEAIVRYFIDQAPRCKVLQKLLASKGLNIEDVIRKGRVDMVHYLFSHPVCGKKIADCNTRLRDIFSGGLVMCRYFFEQAPVSVQEFFLHVVQDRNLIRLHVFCFRYPPPDILAYLLNYPFIFDYVAAHDRDPQSFVAFNKFLESKWEDLERRRAACVAESERAVFDVEGDEAKLCYYILKHLIQVDTSQHRHIVLGNDPEYILNKMNVLLRLPSVAALLTGDEALEHTTGNYLLRLAISLGREAVATRLMQCESVRTLAQRHHFYQDPRGNNAGGLDLREIANHAENAMVALSVEEQKKVAELREYYEPKEPAARSALYKQGFQDLVESLAARYQAHPVKVVVNKEEYSLPLTYQEFQQHPLFKNETHRAQALQAYYQHADHSAWRLFLIPNEWINPRAAWVSVYDKDSSKRHANFSEYKTLITLFWIAASDRGFDGALGVSTEERMRFFIKEMGLITRRHNYDQKRPVKDSKGNPKFKMVEGEKVIITEEYDDLTGDRPSCSNGMERGVSQSLHEHPLYICFDAVLIRGSMLQIAVSYYRSHAEEKERLASQLLALYKKRYLKFEEVVNEEAELLEPWLRIEGLVDKLKQAIEAAFPAKVRQKFDFMGYAARVDREADIVGGHFVYYWPQIKEVFMGLVEKEAQAAGSATAASPARNAHVMLTGATQQLLDSVESLELAS